MNLSVPIIFSLFLFQTLPAQNVEETIRFGDNQLKSGNLTLALKSYQRAAFFSEGKENLYLFKQIAEISYFEKNYENAQEFYGLAYNQSGDDSLKTELMFNKAYCQILNKNYQFAIIDLFTVNDTSRNAQKRLNFYLGTCYFGLEDFKTAQTYFEACLEIQDKKELSDLFSYKLLQTPSPKIARIMSMIIPGLGQVYSGDMKSGINSLLLTSGLIVLGINISIRYQLIDAIVAILPWYQRYFTGGYNKAEAIAIRKRELKRNETYNRILKIVG